MTRRDTSEKWYVRLASGQTVGPCESSKLSEAYRLGNITSETWIRNGDDGEWIKYEALVQQSQKSISNPHQKQSKPRRKTVSISTRLGVLASQLKKPQYWLSAVAIFVIAIAVSTLLAIPKYGDVAGDIVVVFLSGDSDILRGQEVVLIPTTVPLDEHVTDYHRGLPSDSLKPQEFVNQQGEIQCEQYLRALFQNHYNASSESLANVGDMGQLGASMGSLFKLTLEIDELKIESTFTDADGKFTFRDIPVGEYIIVVRHERMQLRNRVQLLNWIYPIEVESGKESKVNLNMKNVVAVYES